MDSTIKSGFILLRKANTAVFHEKHSIEYLKNSGTHHFRKCHEIGKMYITGKDSLIRSIFNNNNHYQQYRLYQPHSEYIALKDNNEVHFLYIVRALRSRKLL